MFSRAAELGVETFFVISGFLITGILLDNRSEEQKSLVLKNFYCRRFLRIFPLFYLVLGMAVLLDSDGLRQSWGWHFGYLFPTFYFYLQNGWTGQLSHFWSLAVEEQFYLVWPLLILSVSMRSLPFVLMTCIFSAPVYAVYMTVSHPGANGPNSAAILMPSCLGALGLGAFLAYAIRRQVGNAMDHARAVRRWLDGNRALVRFWQCRMARAAQSLGRGFSFGLAGIWRCPGASWPGGMAFELVPGRLSGKNQLWPVHHS